MRHIIAAANDELSRNEMLQLALRHNGTVFGGYLRDLMSTRDHTKSDVDVHFLDERDAGAFVLNAVQVAAVRLERHHQGGYYGGGYGSSYGSPYGSDGQGHMEDFRHYRMCAKDFESYIDVVVSKELHPDGTDTDINALAYDKTGLRAVSSPGWSKLDLMEVIRHIRDGVFVALPSCRPHRYERAVKKGWKPLNGPPQGRSYDRR